MSCFGCSRSEADNERLGKRWCSECVASVEFEERLAAANGMYIVEVVIRDGQVVYVLAERADREAAWAASHPIGLTHGDVIGELIAALRALRASTTIVGGCVVATSRDAVRHARAFVDVVTRYGNLLAPDEQRDIADVLSVARTIAGHVH